MKFSVLMSVYYKEKPEYLDACINSIANQTLLPDEIVLVEDGPLTTELYNTIQTWKEKISILKSVILKENSGLARALNIGLKRCSYNLVARMDTNDICVPERFEKQIAYLKEHPAIDILGSQIVEYDEKMETLLGYRKVPLNHIDIKRFAKTRTAFNHMTVIFKRDIVLKLGGYPESLRKMQDFALWGRLLSKNYRAANMSDILVKVRSGEELYNRRTGINYLKNELKALTYIRNHKLINFYEYLLIFIMKLIVRLLPLRILKIIYKKILREN